MKTKTIIVALATLLIGSLCFQACQKDEIQQVKPVETEDILLKSGQGGPKMLPFKGKGTYQYLAFVPDFEKMEIEITVAIEGTATQLGRFQGGFTMLFEFMLIDDKPVPIGYLSHSSIFTAANGDELHNEGSAGPQGPVIEFSEPPGSGFSLTGIPIVGGTGRFENAVGEFVLLVSRDPYDPAPPGEPGNWRARSPPWDQHAADAEPENRDEKTELRSGHRVTPGENGERTDGPTYGTGAEALHLGFMIVFGIFLFKD